MIHLLNRKEQKMKKLLLIPIALLLGLLIVSCEDSTTNPDTTPTTGTLIVQSTPAGASVWVDGTSTGKVTPDTVINLSAGNHSLTLKLDGYKDTVQTSVTITAGSTTTRTITLTRAASTFGPVRLYETTGTTAAQPSGLDLSAGLAYGISSADKDKVDIFYSSTGFVVRSANGASGMTRVTSFKVGSGTNLNDGVDSDPATTGSWLTEIGDRETSYVFLFDNDSHYSKMKITSWGGGTPGNPAWVEVQYIYNDQANSRVF
jgi:hypothetical protein